MGSECVTELLSSNPAPLSFNAVNHKHWNFHCLLVKQSHYFFPHWKNLDLLFHWKFENFSIDNNYSMQFIPGVEISCFYLKNRMFYFFFYFGTYSCVRRNKCQNKKDRSFDFWDEQRYFYFRYKLHTIAYFSNTSDFSQSSRYCILIIEIVFQVFKNFFNISFLSTSLKFLNL